MVILFPKDSRRPGRGLFQPFLRFWGERAEAFRRVFTAETEFQPFLRFWS